jgi:hypothetical protein
MWSIIAVEFMQGYMPALQAEGGYSSCVWCEHAFESILNANLTFFQVITGDGWSILARPMISKHAWTAVVFVAVIFTMVFGLLNLIIAVIVDSAAQAREQDLFNMAQRKDAFRAQAWDCFNDLVNGLDEDGDGYVTVVELREGLLRSPELAAYLTVMGIEETDLAMVFELLDAAGEGYVDHQKFADQLYQMQTQELPIAVCYLKHSMVHLSRQLEKNNSQECEQLQLLEGRVSQLVMDSNYRSSLASVEECRDVHVQCECGNIFMDDARFCRLCGIPRPGVCSCGNIMAPDAVFCR